MSLTSSQLLCFILIFKYASCLSQNPVNKDAVEEATVRLDCRFNPNQISANVDRFAFLWQKTSNKQWEVITVNANPISKNYALDYVPHEGKYDLIIPSAMYDRDNGRFECRIKEIGNGLEVQTALYTLTILIPPGMPQINPPNPKAKEGEPFQLTCSSKGGSPDPIIQWFRDNVPVEGEIQYGGSRDKPTSSILKINPTINDDKSSYRCAVWNRAIREERKLEAAVSLTVHYVPRVKVGPATPYNVLVGADASIHCIVDANPPVRKINWFKNDRILSNKPNHTIIGVVPEDSGTYSCIADNGIKSADGSPGKGDLQLSVVFGPKVTVASEEEATLGDSVSIKCNVLANPRPHRVIWRKDSESQIFQEGEVLKLNRISAANAGRYTCTATNSLKPHGYVNPLERSDNGTVNIRVKHRPGESEIMPGNPIATAGKPFTLSCHAKPAGWPAPEYKWWRGMDGQNKNELGRQQNYTFLSVHVRDEGNYFCQPYNELGTGSIASVYLTVHEAPSIIIPMPPNHVRKEKDRGFVLTCRARGKPKPRVAWFHNGQEINPENSLYRIETSENVEYDNVYIVQSALYFDSVSRRDNELTAADRGIYTCVFDNDIGSPAKAESLLRIEHSPVFVHENIRVAFDLGETAAIQCKASAFPEPKFEWFHKTKALDHYSNRYLTNVTEQPFQSDIYIGTLIIRDVRSSDYGEYTCRAWNSVADVGTKTVIKLQTKSAPEAPSNLEVVEILSDSITIRWKEGFNGGFQNTEFIVTYSPNGYTWKNESCKARTHCRIVGLDSRQEYRFKVMAVNARGFSSYSEELREVTKVNLKDMPKPVDAQYDSEKKVLTFGVEKNALKLVAKIEAREGNSEVWAFLTTVQVRDQYEEVYLRPSLNGGYSDMRIILCLQSNDSWCGYPQLVKIDADSTYLKEAKPFSFEQFILVISVGGSLALTAAVVLLCCCWKKKSDSIKKDYESESDDSRPKVPDVSPPYYSGHDNKGLVNGGDDPNKVSPPPMYTSAPNGHISQNYYLTAEGGDPSPNGTDDTQQTDMWMMKADGMSDGLQDPSMPPYHSHYGTHGQVDPSGYPYAYYPHDEFQPMSDDTFNMNMKNSLYSPYYEESHNAYGTTPGSNMLGDTTNDSQMLPTDPSKINHISFEDDPDYSGNRSGRVIREIIV